MAENLLIVLPGVPGHQHVIGADGLPTCGCKFQVITPAQIVALLNPERLNGRGPQGEADTQVLARPSPEGIDDDGS